MVKRFGGKVYGLRTIVRHDGSLVSLNIVRMAESFRVSGIWGKITEVQDRMLVS